MRSENPALRNIVDVFICFNINILKIVWFRTCNKKKCRRRKVIIYGMRNTKIESNKGPESEQWGYSAHF